MPLFSPAGGVTTPALEVPLVWGREARLCVPQMQLLEGVDPVPQGRRARGGALW